jgi:hypothetical protein
MRCGYLRSAAVLFSALLFAVAAEATPTTYYLVSGPGAGRTTVQVGTDPTSPCPIGEGNCLADTPIEITGAFVTVDLDTNQLLDLQIEVAGSITIDLDGYNGYEQIDVNDASFQMGATPTNLTASGSQFNFFAPGSVSVTSLDIFLAGNTGTTPDDVVFDYTGDTTPTGSLLFTPDGVELNVTGVDLGFVPDPLTGEDVLLKADFTFTGAIPEPSAAATFVFALLIGGAAARKLGGASGGRTRV